MEVKTIAGDHALGSLLRGMREFKLKSHTGTFLSISQLKEQMTALSRHLDNNYLDCYSVFAWKIPTRW